MMAPFLHEKLDILREAGVVQNVPDWISLSLSPQIVLRQYQTLGLENFLTYYETDSIRKNRQVHALFHMATGSGKTVMMAALMLYMYSKGYRKFLFFVNQTNILEKTRENFTNPASAKYLFNNQVEIHGDRVSIKEVNNFASIDDSAINVRFTTTQRLHSDLVFPKEDSVTFEDFEDDKVVLISDESHHVNTWTKKPSKSEEDALKSWEYSVDKIFRANRDNALIEFTATADLQDPNVTQKYLDKIVFDYPLTKFRSSGYTKDFQNLQTDLDPWRRTLVALVVSEYRRRLFADSQQNLKPVVLLKSQKIVESQEFYDQFFVKLAKLGPEDIIGLSDESNEVLERALSYFRAQDPTLHALVQSLQMSFGEDNAIIMNGSTDNTVEKQLAVNSLESPGNPYRVIFTVDMLNEGWDVLNLFDIVRLYETRQSGGSAKKVSPYTIKEAQLIGRGARYCPFDSGEDRSRRKYDYDLENPRRMLETLLYHSKQDSRYIAELRTALIATGLLPSNPAEIRYELKESFKSSDLYRNGWVFANRRVEQDRGEVNGVDKRIRGNTVHVRVTSAHSSIHSIFDSVERSEPLKINRTTLRIKEFPLNTALAGLECFEALRFNVLKDHFPHLKSAREFVTSSNYIGDMQVVIESYRPVISAKDKYEAIKKALESVASYVSGIKAEYRGTHEFFAKRLRTVVGDKSIHVDDPHGDGVGVSQRAVSANLALDLGDEDWFAYNDNFGTTEEKAFVKYFSNIVPDLRKKYDCVYLVRNERFPQLAIYDFESGNRFEPDFVLFLQHHNNDGYDQEQIFIEPKGEHLLERDKWKEQFLLRLKQDGVPVKTYVDDNRYRISGLPFFTSSTGTTDFSAAVEEALIQG